MEDLISVVVSVYNMESILPKTLPCISNQTYRNIEIILVDDGSTDASGVICDEFAKTDGRCKVIHKENGGQGSAKIAGQAVASGAFLFFPDSDDTLNLDMVRILYERISEDPQYDLAISGRKIVYDWDTDTAPFDCSAREIRTVVYSRDDLIQGIFDKDDDRFVYGWNKLYRRRLLENLWFGDYPRHQDFDFNFRVFLKARKAVYVDLSLYHWVQWRGSKTHQSDTWDIYYDCRSAILYNNLKSLSEGNDRFAHYLLDALYLAMVFWEEWCRKSGTFPEVKAKCDKYKKDTLWSYIFSGNIGLGRKFVCILFLTIPAFSHFVMRVTHNAR